MEVKIWSDIRCPFCYIGKHKFEKALEQFEHKDKVKVSWHSFELDPKIKTQPEVSSLTYLADSKGISEERIKQMFDAAVNMGKELDLVLDFNKAVVANTFNAHRLIQFAKTRYLDNEIEEALFKAYFEEGKNIDNKVVLREIAVATGLLEADVDRMLFTDEYGKEVLEDQMTAARIGINSVPFFLFNNKYAMTGAQPVEGFLEVLNKSWNEYEKENTPVVINQGLSCDMDGNCD